MFFLLTSMLASVCAGPQVACAVTCSDSLQLQIEITRDSSLAAPVVRLRILLWNRTDHAIQVIAPVNWPNESAMLEVWDSAGARVASYNLAFPYEVPSGPISPFAVRIPPRGFVGSESVLNPGSDSGSPGFALESPGVYTARLTMVVYSTGSWARQSLSSDTVRWYVDAPPPTEVRNPGD